MSFAERIKSPKLTLQEECFLFSSLMLLTCYFLPWRDQDDSAWSLLARGDNPFTSPFLLLALLMICLAPTMVRVPALRPWVGLVTATSATTALLVTGSADWGALLVRFFALVVLVLSANPAVLKAGDLAMRRLNAQKAEVFNHWGTTLHGVHVSAKEFYEKLENEIRVRQWPGVELLRIFDSEAGLLSHRREYLRVIRQRQVFDICASTFGRDYFFTMREAEIKPQLTLATVLIFLLALWLLFQFCVSTFGLIGGSINFGAFVVVGFLLLLSVLRLGLTRLDGVLMRTPVLGPIYENIFRRSTTYFQYDTRVVFLKLMDDVLKEYVDEETAAKGIKLLSCFEHQPMLDGLYKTSVRETARGKKT